LKKRVVFLIDNKKRDLPGIALISYHLEQMGIETFLEPLEAWRAVLYARKPHMIVFNHLLGSHLVKYSQELHEMGVLTAVLPNEGILYNKEVLEFNASKFHNDAHIDYFFVWNEAHKEALQRGNEGHIKHIETVGVPRFDFYFEPLKIKKSSPSPTVLVCTNFVFAQFLDKDPIYADKLFAPWKERIPSYKDYWEIIKTNHDSREKFFQFLDALIQDENLNIILKPHPSEDKTVYEKWYEKIPLQEKNRIKLDTESFIWELIPQCDVEIACETCTTTLESWIAQKPTIELVLNRHPLFYHEFFSKMTLTCEKPDEIVSTVYKAINKEKEESFENERKRHLSIWCDSPEGKSSRKLALIIKNAVEKSKPDFSKIDSLHKRKGIKLLLLEKLNKPYNYNPLTLLKGRLLPKKYGEKIRIYEKTPKPSDVKFWKNRIKELMHEK